MGSDEDGSEAEGGEGEFGEDAAPGEGTESSHGQTVQNLLPKDVKSADFTVIGKNGVLLLLKLTDVNQSGNIWSAKMSGEVWLPLEDMGLEREGEYLGRFTVLECEINRVPGNELVIKSIDDSTRPMTENEVALHFTGLRIRLLEPSTETRSGIVEDGGAWVYYTSDDPLFTYAPPLDLSIYLQNAPVDLTGYTRK